MSLESNYTAFCKTPIGTAKLTGDADGLQSVSVLDLDFEKVSHEIPEVLKAPVSQLHDYFYKNLKTFNLKLNPQGTTFQKRIWKLLQAIPYGKTISYLELAQQYDDVGAIRAVAHANAKNPIWIIIPCHRVIGKDGSLTGYAGGLWRKKYLLDFENNCLQASLF